MVERIIEVDAIESGTADKVINYNIDIIDALKRYMPSFPK